MSSIFIYSLDNILLDGFVSFFSNNLQNNIFLIKKSTQKYGLEYTNIERFNIIDSFEGIDGNLNSENIVIVNTDFLNDINNLHENYIDDICHKINDVFVFIQYIIRLNSNSDKIFKILFITVNSTLLNVFDFPVSPIYDESVHSFVKSFSKEIKSVLVNCVCIEPIFEMLEMDSLKLYRRQMRVYATQKSPIKLQDFICFIDYILSNNSRLLTGKVFYIGEGL